MIDVLADLRSRRGHRRTLRRLQSSAVGVRIDPTVHLRTPGRLILEDHVFIDAGVVLHCGGAGWGPQDGGITIGSHSYIGPQTTLFGAGGIDIGESALISPSVVITSHQHTYADSETDIRTQSVRYGRVVLERDVWIGANATILPGVRIGSGSVVGAGAVVTRDVPPRTVVMGVPARVARQR